MSFILPLTVALVDMEVWLVRRFQLVFLNLPETREERLRREVRAETLSEIRQEEEKWHTEALREARQKEAENLLTQAVAEANARSAAWYARMKEAQDKDEPFDEPPPWEQ